MKKTVLLAENEEQEIELIRRAFAEAGFAEALCVVRSSAETLRFLAGEAPYNDRERFPLPALLLLGLQLGRRGGADVLRWLQQQPELKQSLAVVVFSVLETPQEMQAAYAWGANSYVVKPLDFPELVTRLKQVRDYWLEINRLPRFC